LQISFDTLASFRGQRPVRQTLVVVRNPLFGRFVEEPDLLAIGATPFAKQQVKAQSQSLNRPERSIQRNRLQPNGLLTIGRNFTHLSDEGFQDVK
jgi:hypothetical protein